MSYFDIFSNSNDRVIKNAADLLEQTTAQYKNKTISKDEYLELCNDIIDYERIEDSISDMVRRQAVYDAFQQLLHIVSTVSKL